MSQVTPKVQTFTELSTQSDVFNESSAGYESGYLQRARRWCLENRYKGIAILISAILLLLILRYFINVKYVVLPMSVPQAQAGEHLPSPNPLHTPEPTMGLPSSGLEFDSSFVTEQQFPEFDQEILDLLKPYNDTNCEYAGNEQRGDGYYVYCKNFLKQSEALVNIGINGYDNIGCNIMIDNSIPNYQYDCTNFWIPYCFGDWKYNYFSYACIGEKTEKTEKDVFYTLEDVLKRHDLLQKHITLKIDCEGCEWSAFKYFPVEYLEYIDQILIQMHFWSISTERMGNLEIIRTLAKHFVNVNYHVPSWLCMPQEFSKFRRLNGFAIQANFVNRKVIKLNSNSRSFALHPLNQPACPNPPDTEEKDRNLEDVTADVATPRQVQNKENS